MEKYLRISEILLVACAAMLLMLSGCGEKTAEGEESKDIQTADTQTDASTQSEPDAAVLVEGHDYFVFEFGEWGGGLSMAGAGTEAGYSLNVIDAETGDWAYWNEMLTGQRQMLSPDGSMILYADVPESKDQLQVRLYDRKSGDSLWETFIDAAGTYWSTRIENAYWAVDKGLVVLDIKSVFYAGRKPDPTGRSVSQLWWLVTFDIETGEQVARYDVISEDATGNSGATITSEGQYTNGRVYLNIPDYPIRDFSPYDDSKSSMAFNIFGVDVETGESIEIDMRGLMSSPVAARFFINTDGTSIIALAEDLNEDNEPRPQGGSIVRIDIETGKWETILEATREAVYGLRGATPDGNAIIFTKHELVDKVYTASQHAMYLDSGRDVQLPVEGLLNHLWISPSGKYAASSNLVRERGVNIINIDSGEVREIIRKTELGTPAPKGFLGGLGSGE
jgi:hypothetical protein